METKIGIDYIEELSASFERFYKNYTASPKVKIDTSQIDIVRDPAKVISVKHKIDSCLRQVRIRQDGTV